MLMELSSVLYGDDMARKMDELIAEGLLAAADSVRRHEEALEECRLDRDRVIWDASQDGYSLGEIGEAAGLAKSTVALVVKMERLRRTPVKG